MNRMIFRFLGPIYTGMEITCLCGRGFGKITPHEQRFSCPKCGMQYEIVQQENHWHLFIEQKELKDTKDAAIEQKTSGKEGAMPNIKEILGLGELSNESFFKSLALGILVGQAVERSINSPSPEIYARQIKEKILKNAGKRLPGSQEIFSEEQARELFELFDTRGIATEFLHWNIF